MALSSLQLEAFLCLSQVGHFTKASERLHVTQSALSQRIQNLEDELGTSLFIRDRSGVKLTASGVELLKYCQIKDSLESELLLKLKAQDSHTLGGVVRVAGYSSVVTSVIIPALAPLIESNPAIRFQCFTRELYDLPGLLLSAQADFVILDHEWERDGVVSLFLGEEEHILVEQKNYRGADVYLDHDENDQTTADYFKFHKKEWSGQRHYLDDIYGIIEGVEKGLGRAILSKHLVPKHFHQVRMGKNPKTPVFLHHFAQPYYSKLHQVVVDTLKKNSKERLESKR